LTFYKKHFYFLDVCYTYSMKKSLFYLALALILSLSFSHLVLAATTVIDSDHDGLSDDLEKQFKTDPHNPDTDGDGYADGLEIANGFDPLSKEPKKLTKTIVINLKKQRLYQELNNIIIKTYIVSTGKASMPTAKGTFTIANKSLRAWSKKYKLWMPYWMNLGGTEEGIHELPEWPNGYKEGANHLGIPVSHGCIRLGVGAAKIVYDWTPIGTKVIVN